MAQQTPKSTLEYSPLPERAQKEIDTFVSQGKPGANNVDRLGDIPHKATNQEGDVETLDDTKFSHHFVDVPGDYETVNFHYVLAGSENTNGEFVVFLHGIPDSWFQWHHQMAHFAKAGYRCLAIDLKGYGQSEKKPGDYRHEGAADQLYGVLVATGAASAKFNLITHDRGTCQGDYIVAKHPEAVLRYGRGEQHLYHFNPVLSPQGEYFANAPRTGLMEDAKGLVTWGYAELAHKEMSAAELVRVVQEFSYPGVADAVPRYFNSSTFRTEWLDRRNRLLPLWKCPVLVMQGYYTRTQPREFYEHARDYIPNAKDVDVVYLPGGHFWTLECPSETTDAVEKLLSMTA